MTLRLLLVWTRLYLSGGIEAGSATNIFPDTGDNEGAIEIVISLGCTTTIMHNAFAACLGQDVRALGVPADKEWAATMAVFNYIVGVGGHNAANAQFARAHSLDRTEMLASLARASSDLHPAEYPFARSIGTQLSTHDDRADFLAGIDFIINGIIVSISAP